jgi:squalene monooxygenase
VTATEILTFFAVMQWNVANISVREMKSMGHHHWTMVHAFCANAGGFVLETLSFPPFPINATSLFYLVSRGQVTMPTITEKNNWDRSKADLFAKYVAFVQTAWLLCTTIVRGIQKLPITPIELFTVAFVVPTVATQFFWAKKPQNVEAPVVLNVDWEIEELLKAAGTASMTSYVDTPMDFIEKPMWDGWKRRPSLLHFGGLEKRPLERIPNDYSPPPPTGKEATFIWFISIAHAGIHCAGWNLEFATLVELVLWRTSSLTLLVVMAVGGIVPVLSTRPWFDFSFNLLWIWVREARKKTWIREWAFASLVNCAYAAYILARLIIFAELFSVFRWLPREAYQDINWSGFWPHAN